MIEPPLSAHERERIAQAVSATLDAMEAEPLRLDAGMTDESISDAGRKHAYRQLALQDFRGRLLSALALTPDALDVDG